MIAAGPNMEADSAGEIHQGARGREAAPYKARGRGASRVSRLIGPFHEKWATFRNSQKYRKLIDNYLFLL